MNTKGIKFLAVLAVMVMAFAAVFILAPADNDDAVIVYGNADVKTGITEISTSGKSSSVTGGEIYVADDVTIKVKDALESDLIIYVQNGKEVNIDFKVDPVKKITIYTVTGDQEATVRMTTSTTPVNNGKIVLDGTNGTKDTKFEFIGERGQSVFYKAASVTLDFNYTTSGLYVNKLTSLSSQSATVGADKAFTNVPTAGKHVSVASGQTIEVTSSTVVSNLGHGAQVYDKAASTITYYSKGADVGSVKMLVGDYIDFTDKGSASIAYGTSAMKLSEVKGLKIEASTTDNQFTITGTMKNGTANLTGAGDFSVTTEMGTTVTLASKSTATGSIAVGGIFAIKTFDIEGLTITGTGTILAQNEKLWDANHNIIECASEFSGLVDTSAVSKVLEIKDDISRATIYPDQTFRVINSVNVYTSLIVDGILIIEEGVTLTINEAELIVPAPTSGPHYAQIINNGTIMVKDKGTAGLGIYSGSIVNNGTIQFSAKTETADPIVISSSVYSFMNNGKLEVSRNDSVEMSGVFNNGTIDISGAIYADPIYNFGTVTLNNATIEDYFAVDLGKDAVLKINSVKMDTEDSVYVANTSMSDTSVTADSFAGIFYNDNGAGDIATVRGLTFTGDKLDKTTYTIDIDGTIGVTIPDNTAGSKFVGLGIANDISVEDNLVIPKNVKFATAVIGSDLYVSGEMTLMDGSAAINNDDLSMFVDGQVTTMKGDLLDGAAYSGGKFALADATHIYTKFENAITLASASDVNSIIIGDLEPVVVEDDVVIPEGLSIDEESADSMIIIGTDDVSASISIASTGKINLPVEVYNGYLYAYDAADIYEDDVTAHVIFGGEDDVTYASLNAAIEKFAETGMTLTLVNDFVMDGSTLVIPAGITVDAISNDVAFICIDSNLAVNGTLVVDEFSFVAETNDDLEISVNGTIMEETTGVNIEGHWFTPNGVSYTDTIIYDGEEKVFFVITDISNIQAAIDAADDAKVAVEGDAVLDELTVSGRDDMPAEVTFKGDVEVGVINIDEVTLIFSDGTQISTTVRNAVGSITITGAYVDKYMSIYDMAIYSSEDVGVYMEGVVTDNAIGTYGILFEGITGMDGTDTKTSINYGNYVEDESVVDTPAIVFAGETTVIGKKVNINDNEDLGVNAMVTVTGTLYVYHASKLNVNSDVQVTGGIFVAAKDDDGIAGAIDLNGNIFVGMLEEDIYDYSETMTNGEAILYGKITLGAGKFIFAAPDATVDPAIVEDLDTMNIYVDDEVWFTLYGYSGVKFKLDNLVVPMFNARVAGIYDAELNPISYKMVNGNIIDQKAGTEKTLVQYGAIYIGLDYEIFEVKIKTDGSVKAVYIDGILMETGESKNIFIMKNVAAGTYKVTVEAATGYDADKCVLYTELGTILPNMGFTFTEYDVTEWDGEDHDIPVVVYNINGTEIQPEPVPPTPEEESQWTVTTILLVILVVLIAIMAVIVALRLNRS